MASAKFDGGKCKGGSAAKALMRHNDISIESRKIAAIENPHINISKSHLNFSFDGLTYAERCSRYDKRIKELDSSTNTNKRKDRVTMQGIEIPRPKDLPEDQIGNWFADVWEILKNQYGAENVIYGDVHVDEVHDYIDSVTGEWETSREHGHFGVIPEVDGVLNGKAFFSRKNMRILNNSIETMTKQKYGCKFQTGEKRKSKETIEELKTKSEKLQFQETMEAMQEQMQEITIEWNTIKREKELIKAEKAKIKADKEAIEVSKQETLKQRNEASNVLRECNKLHENLKFQSKSYAEAPISRIQEKKLVELDSKLSIAYDLANQQRNEDKQYE